MIRGDRRTQPRATSDRRTRARTPGRFKHICDVAFASVRELEKMRAAGTSNPSESKNSEPGKI